MKTNFTTEDLERAFGSGGHYDRNLFMRTFSEIFSRHPPELLVRMPEHKLEELVNKLSNSENVRQIRAAIEEEVQQGEESLYHLSMMMFAQLQKLGVAPQDKSKIYYKPYQEVWAFCATDMHEKKAKGLFVPSLPIARGLFETKIPLEKVFFTTENTFHSNLREVYRDGKLECKDCDKDMTLRRVGALHVFRDRVTDDVLAKRVGQVIQNASDKIYGRKIKSAQRRYEIAERDIVDRLYKMFQSLKAGGMINYQKVYKIFEWARRENIELNQVIENHELSRILRQEIERFVPLPYAVIRARVKQAESEFLKVLRALYNITTGDEKDPVKRYKDKYGLRVILPTVENVFDLQDTIRRIVGLEVIGKWEDYITDHKPNEYKSYHMTIRMGGAPYALQIRTHQMDRDAKKNREQSEDNLVLEKIKSVRIVPDAVKLVVATVYGV